MAMILRIFGLLSFLCGTLIGYEAMHLWTSPVHVGMKEIKFVGWVLAANVPEGEIMNYIICFLTLSVLFFLVSLYLFKQAWLKKNNHIQ
ncbi:hypothetical protein [Laceyella putida]|uniref:DUF4306 domain-containing protein n=1 Tax=Laceyella putida TaxID=110101 RepID=A0ABW2RMY7_9BACL